MAGTVESIAEKYKNVDSRQLKQLLQNQRYASTLPSETLTEMHTAAEVKFWPSHVRQVYSLLERGYTKQTTLENKAAEQYGLAKLEVADALDYISKSNRPVQDATVTWEE